MKQLIFGFLIPIAFIAPQITIAGMDKDKFVKQCMQLATKRMNANSIYSCEAASAKDAAELQSVKLNSKFSINTKGARIGVWGDGVNDYRSEIAVILKSGVFGFESKALRVHCDETKTGAVILKNDFITVDIKNNVDFQTTANVICR